MSAKGSGGPDYKLAYEQLCTSYHAIDDFRTKLLGFLPLASGAGIYLLVGDDGGTNASSRHLSAVALFGLAVTLGLYVFEVFGIAKCARLISVGRDLELAMKLESFGQFTKLPEPVGGKINEPVASAVVYPAVLAAWAYLALLTWSTPVAAGAAVVVFVVGFYWVYRFEKGLRAEEQVRCEERERRVARRESGRAAAAAPAAPAALNPPGAPTRLPT